MAVRVCGAGPSFPTFGSFLLKDHALARVGHEEQHNLWPSCSVAGFPLQQILQRMNNRQRILFCPFGLMRGTASVLSALPASIPQARMVFQSQVTSSTTLRLASLLGNSLRKASKEYILSLHVLSSNSMQGQSLAFQARNRGR